MHAFAHMRPAMSFVSPPILAPTYPIGGPNERDLRLPARLSDERHERVQDHRARRAASAQRIM
jgi:hypothetical protein